jgi:hypothetical protein
MILSFGLGEKVKLAQGCTPVAQQCPKMLQGGPYGAF